MPRTIVAEVESGALTPGDYIGSVYSVGGKRWYVLHIPETYDSDVPTPLVINLHGRTSNPVEQALTSQMTPRFSAAAVASTAGFCPKPPSPTSEITTRSGWAILTPSAAAGPKPMVAKPPGVRIDPGS